MTQTPPLWIRLVAGVLSVIIVLGGTLALAFGLLFVPSELLGRHGAIVAIFLFLFGGCLAGPMLQPVARRIAQRLFDSSKARRGADAGPPDAPP
jgi:hypothetical protein